MRFRYAPKRQSARGVINTLFKREDCAVFTRGFQTKHLVFRVFVTQQKKKDKRVRCTHRRVKK